MSEARRLGRSLSFLLEKSTEEKRKDNLKKYFLDPNCMESLQNEIIKLRKELEGIQVNTKTEYNLKIKDELLYTIKEASKLSHIACRTIQRRCVQNSLKKTNNRYLITGRILKEWIDNPLYKREIEYYSDSFSEGSNITKTYLIKNRRNGFYKIGRSNNPLKREQTLQSEEPDVVMVKTWSRNIERKLHIEYKDYRVRGEWFELSKAQVKYICTNYERS